MEWSLAWWSEMRLPDSILVSQADMYKFLCWIIEQKSCLVSVTTVRSVQHEYLTYNSSVDGSKLERRLSTWNISKIPPSQTVSEKKPVLRLLLLWAAHLKLINYFFLMCTKFLKILQMHVIKYKKHSLNQIKLQPEYASFSLTLFQHPCALQKRARSMKLAPKCKAERRLLV